MVESAKSYKEKYIVPFEYRKIFTAE
jgi:hypothetical protein